MRFTSINALDVAGSIIEGREPAEQQVRSCVFRILEQNVLCSIATVTPSGDPHINTAYFSYSDGLELYFLSHAGSLHCRNLSRNPSMAMAVFSSAQEWTESGRGLQLFGTVEETAGSFADDAERSYAARFEFYSKWKTTLDHGDLAREYRFYRFVVTRVKILDEGTLGDAVWVVGSVARP